MLRQSRLHEGGGPGRIEKQHEAGKLTARERIDALVDPGSFHELMLFAEHRATLFGMDGRHFPAEAVVTGTATIDEFLDAAEIMLVEPVDDETVRGQQLQYGAILNGLQRVSSPGRRVYKSAGKIDRVKGGIGVSIVSTSEGLLTDREARRRNLGGEVLCEVW